MTPCNPKECNPNVCRVTSGHIGTTSGVWECLFPVFWMLFPGVHVHFRVLLVLSHRFPVVEGHFRWNRSLFRSPWRTSGKPGGLPDHRGLLPVSYSMIRKYISMVQKSSRVAGSPPTSAEAALYGPEVLTRRFLLCPAVVGFHF